MGLEDASYSSVPDYVVFDSGFVPEQGPVQESEIKLSAKQVTVLLSTVAITVALAGIRGGKTHVGALKMILKAMTQPCQADETHLVGSPTYQMSKVPVEKIFKLLYDKTIFPVCPLIKYVRSERRFILAAAGGGVTYITVRSLHDPDRLRGIKALSAWLDEAAYIAAYAWEVVLGRLADSNGPCWITTTPSGYNWVYELYSKARGGGKNIRIVHWESTENTFIEQAGITRLADHYDARTHQQEIGARFIKGRGLVYYAFTKRNIYPGKINPRAPVWIGQDFNVDPMATVIGQPFTSRDGHAGVHILEVRRQADSDTYRLGAWLESWCQVHHVDKKRVTIMPDAAGRARSTSGKSDFEILKGYGFKVDAPARNPLVKDRVNCVNGLFRPMRASPRLLIDSGCTELIECLEKQIWKPNSDPPTPDKEHGFDHLNDALGYLCWRKWPLKTTTTLPRRAA